ncbi:glycosyltransferase [Halorussus salinisoli]|uniref:glycosyltransferase n=1 Tax=Halorussus salinisoli TaxID=2558242 RepID=UPI0010C224A5|nr:glycosyltransferase [Halorussus salinisoli]
MNCLVITPHRLGIHEMAKRVGAEWSTMGHTVDYIFAEGSAAQVGPFTVGAPGIAIWWYRTLKNVAQDHDQYDLIWTHQPITPILPTTERTFWEKVIVTIHTTLRRDYELAQDGVYPSKLLPYYWLVKVIEGHFHRTCTDQNGVEPHYTVVSPHLRKETRAFGVDNPIYIPNGVFTPDAEDLSSIRSEYDIPDSATLIFNIGSLTSQKRPVTFARLMHEVTESTDNVYCVMAGDGPLRDTVESYESEFLRVLGYITDEEKWRWFADANVFASLSAYEGMPVATVEALSFDLPVVLSRIPAHRHLLNEYNASGELVADDATEIRTAVQKLQAARSEVMLPEWRTVATQYLQLVNG